MINVNKNTFESMFKTEVLDVYASSDVGLAEKFYKYYVHLMETNKKINLTAITEQEDVIKKHFADSLLPLKADLIKENMHCADIGTGAGFPGLPLAMFRPDIKMTLIDSLKKRLNFLDEVLSLTETANCETVHARAEDHAKSGNREKYDLVFSRAVSRLATLTELCLPLVRVGGKMVALKSKSAQEELSEAQKVIELLGGKAEPIFGTEERNLIIITKVSPTPPIYPRKAGTPEKFPII